MIVEVTETFEVNLDRMHDVLLEVTDKSYDDDDLKDFFHSLPEEIRFLAYQYGGNDTVFGDACYVHFKKAFEWAKEMKEKKVMTGTKG
jgi:hypothetical protein